MRKSKFNLTHLHSTTLDPGYLVPFLCLPTLPNDTFRIGLSTFIRAQPMLAPLMHEVRLFTQYWFVPNRIIWDEWEDFITGGQDLSLTPPLPYIISNAEDAKAGSLWDYLGFPLLEGLEVSALPFRALAEIWNTRYRDEDLQEEIPIDYSHGEDTTTSRKLLSPAFAKDYFTIARPFTQRGGDVLVPVSQGVNTGTGIAKEITFSVLMGVIGSKGDGGGLVLQTPSPNLNAAFIQRMVFDWISSKVADGSIDSLIYTLPTNDMLTMTQAALDSHFVGQVGNSIYTGIGGANPSNVNFSIWCFPHSVTELKGNFSQKITLDVSKPVPDAWFTTATTPYWSVCSGGSCGGGRFYNFSTGEIIRRPNSGTPPLTNAYNQGTMVVPETVSNDGFSIRDLRRSSALQRYAERSLKYGNRYEEFIQREFGIRPRDYRIQRPEYIGGGRGILNISEVLQTAEGTDTGVGTMRGHGVASISQRPIRFRCPEHGIILGLLSIRPKSVYTQGIDREWLKRSRLDFFTPELASIGMQEVLQQELYATPDNKQDVFGYSERYQEYRYQKPLVTGEFRTTLNFWNMARMFANSPNLNAEFISMEYAVDDFKRPFQIQDNSAHAFVCMLKNHIRAFRPIPKRAKEVLK